MKHTQAGQAAVASQPLVSRGTPCAWGLVLMAVGAVGLIVVLVVALLTERPTDSESLGAQIQGSDLHVCVTSPCSSPSQEALR